MKTATIYHLKRDGVTLHTGSEDGCHMKLQRIQSHSAQWALKYEGYSIEPQEVSEEQAKKAFSADPYSYSEVILQEDSRGGANHRLKATLNGKPVNIYTQAARMQYNAKKGDKVEVMNGHIVEGEGNINW